MTGTDFEFGHAPSLHFSDRSCGEQGRGKSEISESGGRCDLRRRHQTAEGYRGSNPVRSARQSTDGAYLGTAAEKVLLCYGIMPAEALENG
jgi:hypothetical protein